MKRFVVIASAGAIVVAAVVAALGPIAQASTGPGALDCPTLAVYNPTHYGLQVGATVTCTIDNSGVADGSVDVIIQSSDLGNTKLTGTASGGTITFTYTAPANGCNTGIVAYGPTATLADNSVISGGTAAAGFAFVDANGAVITTCVTASPSPSSSPSPTPGTSPSPSPSPQQSPSPSPSPQQSPSPSPTAGTSPSPSPTAGTSPSPSPTPTPFGAVLAATGNNTPAQDVALFLIAFGLLAMVGGAIAWRRRRI